MSTKSTIVSGPTFHLYLELADGEDAVYLELDGVHYQATYNRVVVPIPVHIWEVIRAYPGVDLSWAAWSDEELRAYVERRIDERLARAALEVADGGWQQEGTLCWAGVPQAPAGERWVVVRTTHGEQRARATLQRQVEQAHQTWEKRLWHLRTQRFACEPDAQAALAQ
jgi:hypothetical protein